MILLQLSIQNKLKMVAWEPKKIFKLTYENMPVVLWLLHKMTQLQQLFHIEWNNKWLYESRSET